MELIYIINIFEVTAVFLAIYHYKKYASTTEKYFLHFLIYMVFTEILGFTYSKMLKPNIWIFIIYVFISFLFYFYWFYTILKKSIYKKFIVVSSFVFIAIAIYNMSTQSWMNYQISTFYTGAIISTIASVFFFSELLNSNKILSIKHSLRFWIATGLLLFNVGMIPFIAFSNDYKLYPELRNIILVVMNLILYTCYSLGFIWAKAEHKQSF